MRVLIVHPHLNIKGGSERLTKVLIDGLTQIGENMELQVVTGVYTEDWFGRYSDKIKLLKMGLTAQELKEELGKIVQEFSPDTVIVMVQEPYYCYVVKSYIKNVRTLMYVHFPLDEEISEENLREYERHLRYPTLTPMYISYPDVIVVNSRRTKLAVDMLWQCKSEVVYPCIDDIFFKNSPDIEKRRDNTILYVGRFNILKRQDVLLLMFPLIKEEVKDARLILAGFVDPRHSEYYDHLKAVIESMIDKYKDVELIPNPSDEKLIQLYQEAKVYVHVRIGEHFGMAPVEAMSQGTPVVIRLPTGLAEVAKHEVHGFFAESDYELLHYTIKVLKMSNSDMIEIRKRVVEFAKQFTARNFAENIMRLIRG